MHRLGVSFEMQDALLRDARSADIVHGHSLWMLPNVYPALAAQRSGRPLIISPRGTLSPVALRRSRIMKALFWRLFQGPAVRKAACLHATSVQECQDIRKFGLLAPIATLPNGIDIPNLPTRSPKTGSLKQLLYLCRLHPIKGIEHLLNAWAAVQSQFPDWVLRIVGPDAGGYRKKLEALTERLQLARVTFLGPRYGDDKWAEYAAADAYVLPSHSENFGMSVAEAMACGLPVITTTSTPWVDLDSRRVGWSVTPDVNALTQALRSALSTPQGELIAIGQRGRKWMAEEFSWKKVAKDMIEVYRWLLGGGEPPRSVRLD